MGGRVMSVGCTTLRYTPYELLQRSVVTSYDGSYPRARAQSVDDALLALRPPRDAHAAPVQDQRVREPRPLVARHERHQVALDLHRVLLCRQTEQRRESLHVGVDHDPFVLAEPGAEHDVRGLAAHTGELNQLLHGVGYRTSMALDQRLRHPDDGFGLVAEEPRAVDLLLEDPRVGAREVLCRLVLREQGGCDHVDACIGRLSGEDRGDEQLERALVMQRAGRVGIGLLETGDDLADACPPLGLRLVARASARWGFCLRGHQPAATSRARANARNASASRVFRTWSGSSQPLRAIPRPTATLAMPLVEWASAPIEQVTPSSRARRTMRQSRSRRCGSAFTSTAMPRAAALASTCSRSIAYRSEEHTSELQSLAYLVCRLLLEKKKTEHIARIVQHRIADRCRVCSLQPPILERLSISPPTPILLRRETRSHPRTPHPSGPRVPI